VISLYTVSRWHTRNRCLMGIVCWYCRVCRDTCTVMDHS